MQEEKNLNELVLIQSQSKKTSGQCSYPGLTVIIPAYNEANSVGDTLHSLQRQTWVPDEIIIVDDCSCDGTGE